MELSIYRLVLHQSGSLSCCHHLAPLHDIRWLSASLGIGAVFVSTLALHEFLLPSNPPQSQQDILIPIISSTH